MTADSRLEDFFCPLCRSNECRFVVVHTPKGDARAVRDLFQCGGCSVVFTDPRRFAELRQSTFTGKWREQKATREYPPDAVTKDSTGPY